MCFLCLEERRKAQSSSKQSTGPRESPFFFFFGSRECLDLVVIAWLIKPWFVS